MDQKNIKRILIALEESVDKDVKKKKQLKESELAHVVLDLVTDFWNETSHMAHHSGLAQSDVMKAVAASLYGPALSKVKDIKTVWNKIVTFGKDKLQKLGKAAQALKKAADPEKAAEWIENNLIPNLEQNLEPQLQPVFAEAKRVRKEKALKEAAKERVAKKA